MCEALKDRLVSSRAKQWILEAVICHDELCAYIKHDDILDLLAFLKETDQFEFQTLISICAVDYPERPDRFKLIYNLLSVTLNQRLRICTYVDEESIVQSITTIYPGSKWYEREVWDMFGVMFKGNPDLRRILTDYGFEGHPLRKDFPLSGHTQVRYDISRKEVVYEKLFLPQEFREFDFNSPWRGVSYVLPGDEKAS
jgi:NADH-quinone oxidoreductase subunit C